MISAVLSMVLSVGTTNWAGFVHGLVTQPTYFPPAPIPVEFAMGRTIAGRRTATLASTYLADRQTIGSWYDGMMSRDVEHAVWLSPRLISRMLGFLSRRESLESDEVLRRWNAIRGELEGRLTFILDLAALKKVSMADLTPEVPATTMDIEGIRCFVDIGEDARKPLHIDLADQSKEREEPVAVYRWAPGSRIVRQRIPATTTQMGLWRVRDRKTLFEFKWWLEVPVGAHVTPLAESRRRGPLYPLGDYYGAWYWVQTRALPGTYYTPRFTLVVQSPSKERRAKFDANLAPPGRDD
ncbi:MAG TPA: hypothetical protein PLL78_01410 [Fimbriimonadaceae bacterium]|nr:hypothetical protein [Fimbriimonadaceae bacterium]HRJ95318.1 hypothetical protein [Fimbriimonadaceae bacterium]